MCNAGILTGSLQALAQPEPWHALIPRYQLVVTRSDGSISTSPGTAPCGYNAMQIAALLIDWLLRADTDSIEIRKVSG